MDKRHGHSLLNIPKMDPHPVCFLCGGCVHDHLHPHACILLMRIPHAYEGGEEEDKYQYNIIFSLKRSPKYGPKDKESPPLTIGILHCKFCKCCDTLSGRRCRGPNIYLSERDPRLRNPCQPGGGNTQVTQHSKLCKDTLKSYQVGVLKLIIVATQTEYFPLENI